MKKTISILLAVMLVFALAGCSNSSKSTDTDAAATVTDAQENTVSVFVSVATDKLNLAYEKTDVTDKDKDGIISINDALFCAHEEYFDGGASEGYSAQTTEYGISLYKLWGTENGGCYGYYVNDISGTSLLDEVKDGDGIYAFAYTDTSAFSDAYSYFDKKTADINTDEELVLTLSAVSFDESFSPVSSALEGAVITVDGEKTEYTTDETGTAALKLSVGEHTISAVSENGIITPPVCLVTVK